LLTSVTLPADTSLATWRSATDAEERGIFVDCYGTDVSRDVSIIDFMFAFYCTLRLKPERCIPGIAAGRT
jgi:hypothetical protein